MKTFQINRDSWHYKLNKNFFQDTLMERQWEPKHASFCKYWSATMFRIVGAAIMAAMTTILLFLIAFAIWTDPLTVLKGVIVFIGIFGAVLSIAVLVDYVQTRPTAMPNDEPKSMIAMKYYSFKNKICPMIEFKDSEKQYEGSME